MYICWSLTHLLDSTLSGEDILDFENVYFVIKTANKQITLSILSQKINLMQEEMAAIARLAKNESFTLKITVSIRIFSLSYLVFR